MWQVPNKYASGNLSTDQLTEDLAFKRSPGSEGIDSEALQSIVHLEGYAFSDFLGSPITSIIGWIDGLSDWVDGFFADAASWLELDPATGEFKGVASDAESDPSGTPSPSSGAVFIPCALKAPTVEESRERLKQRLAEIFGGNWTPRDLQEFNDGFLDGFASGLADLYQTAMFVGDVGVMGAGAALSQTTPGKVWMALEWLAGGGPVTDAVGGAGQRVIAQTAQAMLSVVEMAPVAVEIFAALGRDIPKYLVTAMEPQTLGTYVVAPRGSVDQTLGRLIDVLDPIFVELASSVAESPRTLGYIAGAIAFRRMASTVML